MEEIRHKFQALEGKNTLVIYVDYPDDYEFSLDFNSFKKNVKNIADKIREYAFNNLNKFSNETALLVLNGVVVGTILLTSLNSKIQAKEITNITNINNTKLETVSDSSKNNIPLELKTYEKQIPKEELNNVNNTNTVNSSNQTINNTTVKENSNNNSNDNQNVTKSEEKITQNTTSTNEKMVSLKLNSGTIISISLEEYVTGVVSAEMPASFNVEALKAQAIAARTYALKRIASGTILSATTSHQVYKTESQLRNLWGSSYDTYYNKVKNAVNSTKDKYMTYNGNYIDALYFSTSNGKTEDPIYVWGTAYPYIKSVDSVEASTRNVSYTKTMSISELSSKLGVTPTSNSDITILSKTTGNRVNQISICGKIFTGVKIRELLGLRSADFDISISNSIVTITTRGYGHGCGMSQYGANEMAKQGKNYEQILQHYYTNIEIKS